MRRLLLVLAAYTCRQVGRERRPPGLQQSLHQAIRTRPPARVPRRARSAEPPRRAARRPERACRLGRVPAGSCAQHGTSRPGRGPVRERLGPRSAPRTGWCFCSFVRCNLLHAREPAPSPEPASVFRTDVQCRARTVGPERAHGGTRTDTCVPAFDLLPRD